MRLKNQGLRGGGASGSIGQAGSRFHSPEALVAWMGCIQAQDFGQAKWAIGVRGRKVTEADVDAAYNKGRILRTHVLRPTWHFVLPSDIRWMLVLTAPRIRLFCQPHHRKLGIDAAVLRKSRKVLVEALEGGKALTRSEIAALFRRGKINTEDIRMGFLLMDAELEGLICSGPRKGKQFTYALLEERAPAARVLSSEEALEELASRYFRSRGPATAADFAWWSGLTITQAKRGLEMVKGGLESAMVEGTAYWFEKRGGAAVAAPPVLLLPAFDEYTVAYKDRALVVAAEYVKMSSHGLKPMVLVNGRMAGSWRREVGKGKVFVDVAGFDGLGEKVWAAVKREAKKYAVFAAGELEFQQR